MNILFVDPSMRSTGVYGIMGDGTLSYTFKTESEHNGALGEIAREFRDKAQYYDVLLIEDYAFSRASQSVSKNGEVGGIIKGNFAYYGKTIIEISISTWKSICNFRMKKDTAKTKAAYIDAVYNKFGIHFDSTDSADAYMLYYSCKQILEGKAKDTEATARLWVKLKAAGIDVL